jgi:hypothetical protein
VGIPTAPVLTDGIGGVEQGSRGWCVDCRAGSRESGQRTERGDVETAQLASLSDRSGGHNLAIENLGDEAPELGT